MSTSDDPQPLRLLVVARRPFQLGDLGLPEPAENESRQLLRRPAAVDTAIAETDPNVVMVDTGFTERSGFKVIEEVCALAPEAGVLALTPDPPPYEDVAQAINAGATGFVDVDAEPSEFEEALSAVRHGGVWLPSDDVLRTLAGVGGDLGATASERRSRLTGILLGLVPLTGLLAALMSFLWRRYVGQLGVRPVDLAVDPASRVVDAIISLSLVLGAFGPLLFVSNWLDLLRASPANRGVIAWFLDHRKTAQVVLSIIVLTITWFLTRGPDLLLVWVIGPAVAVALVAQITDLSDEVPRFLRIKTPPIRALVGGAVALFVFFAIISGEAMFVGPSLGPRGEGGVIVPRVIGFNAQPVEASNVDTGDEPRQLLYLGGNADLYVLVDPCNDNNVEYVSVGSHRLQVIDEITCPTSEGS